MQVIVGGEEAEAVPTPEWIRRSLRQIERLEQERYLALLRGAEDQLNVLCEPDGFTLEWYLGDRLGPHVAYRDGEGADHQPLRRKGFFASIFSAPAKALGSRLTLEAVAAVLDAYVMGANEFPGLRWEKLYR